MLCGENPLGGDFRPNSLLLGYVQSYRPLGGVLWRRGTRACFSLLMKPKVRPFLLLPLSP